MKYFYLILFMVISLTCATRVRAQQVANGKHVVKSGETLYSISREYNISVSQLKQWNHLNDNEIAVGQAIWISQPSAGADSLQNKPVNTPPPSFLEDNSGGTDYYTVEKGDNLYKISREFNMTLEQLKKLNNLSSNVINVGQRLLVREQSSAPSVSTNENKSTPQGRFTKYRVKRGESLKNILRRFQMDSTEFKALNPGAGSDLFRNEEITVLLPPTVHHANPYLLNSTLKDVTLTPAIPYKDQETGDPTTSGDLYNPDALTAASSGLPLGSVVYVVNPVNSKGIFVLINDRITGDKLKLSKKAYDDLGLDPAQSSVKILQNY